MRKNQKTFILILAIMLVSTTFVVGCQEHGPDEEEEELQIVASFSVLADIVEEIGGDKVQVDYIVPRGEEPEEYEPSPSDFEYLSDSDVFFINGYNLETWLEQVAENVSDVDVVKTAEEGPAINLDDSDIPDPHLWLNPQLVKDYYMEKIVSTLRDLDPDNTEYYEERAKNYKGELEELHELIKDKTDDIPDDHRLIITSENAFVYFGDEYDFDTDGIWEINAHEEGTPQQISRIIDIVEDTQVPSVFKESTVDPQYMESVSDETGVEVNGEVYTDGIGDEGTGAESYLDMMEINAQIIGEALSD